MHDSSSGWNIGRGWSSTKQATTLLIHVTIFIPTGENQRRKMDTYSSVWEIYLLERSFDLYAWVQRTRRCADAEFDDYAISWLYPEV